MLVMMVAEPIWVQVLAVVMVVVLAVVVKMVVAALAMVSDSD